MISSRFAGSSRGQFRQTKKRRRTFRFLHAGGDLPQHVERVGQAAQGARIEERSRGQFIAAAFESPETGEQIAAVHGRDVARMQRLELAQVIPIKEMTFETLEPIHRFERPEVARHQVVDRDVAEVVRRHRRQHPEPDVGR